MPQLALGRYIIAGLIAVAGLATVTIGTLGDQADMRIEPHSGNIRLSEQFVVEVIIESNTPVNVFGGEINFDPAVIQVASIDYNTSAADLWAEKPWYSNGDGTLNFVGGTTKRGGFVGTAELLSITFNTTGLGESIINIGEARILRHDGLGTDAPLAESIDAIYAIKENLETEAIMEKDIDGPTFNITPGQPNTDLNNDGKQSFSDVGIFLKDFATQNNRSDFNGDNKVDTKDLNILLAI